MAEDLEGDINMSDLIEVIEYATCAIEIVGSTILVTPPLTWPSAGTPPIECPVTTPLVSHETPLVTWCLIVVSSYEAPPCTVVSRKPPYNPH